MTRRITLLWMLALACGLRAQDATQPGRPTIPDQLAQTLKFVDAQRAEAARLLEQKTGTEAFDADFARIIHAAEARYAAMPEKNSDGPVDPHRAFAAIAAIAGCYDDVLPIMQSLKTKAAGSGETSLQHMMGFGIHGLGVDDAAVPLYQKMVRMDWFTTSNSAYHDDAMAVLKFCDANHAIPRYYMLIYLNGSGRKREWDDDFKFGDICYEAGDFERAMKYYHDIPKLGMGAFRMIDASIALKHFDQAEAICAQIEKEMDAWVAEQQRSIGVNLAVPLQNQTRESLLNLLAERRNVIAAKGPPPAQHEFPDL